MIGDHRQHAPLRITFQLGCRPRDPGGLKHLKTLQTVQSEVKQHFPGRCLVSLREGNEMKPYVGKKTIYLDILRESEGLMELEERSL